MKGRTGFQFNFFSKFSISVFYMEHACSRELWLEKNQGLSRMRGNPVECIRVHKRLQKRACLGKKPRGSADGQGMLCRERPERRRLRRRRRGPRISSRSVAPSSSSSSSSESSSKSSSLAGSIRLENRLGSVWPPKNIYVTQHKYTINASLHMQ